ncbi:agmatinase [Candidatus Heimdallarchaeota archaeon B3_Heim]|nr:MAG: agmatinase [Candidatus Heimdallarchaeota archaeon B3_Heim]
MKNESPQKKRKSKNQSDDFYQKMSLPRFTGISTFMRTPYITDLSNLDIAIIGVPYDGAVENRPGARDGPREIRNMSSMMRSIHHATRINPYKNCRIADVGDVPITHYYSIQDAHNDITQFYNKVHAGGVIPMSVGGDHSICLPIFRAIAKDQPIGLIHIDAHTDTCDEEMGYKFTHGTPFRRAVEEGLLDPAKTIQIGIRGAQNSEEGWKYSHESGMRVVFIEEFMEQGVNAIINETRKKVGNSPTYISFDIDSLDPAYAPGTGTPEVGGISTFDAQMLLRGLRGLNLVGGDLVEVSPSFDPSGNTALVAATMIYEILCLLSESCST